MMRRSVTAPVSWYVGTLSGLGLLLVVASVPLTAWWLLGVAVAASLRRGVRS